MCLHIHAKFRGDRPLRGRDLKGGSNWPPPSKNLLSKSPVKIGLNYLDCFPNIEIIFCLWNNSISCTKLHKENNIFVLNTERVWIQYLHPRNCIKKEKEKTTTKNITFNCFLCCFTSCCKKWASQWRSWDFMSSLTFDLTSRGVSSLISRKASSGKPSLTIHDVCLWGDIMRNNIQKEKSQMGNKINIRTQEHLTLHFLISFSFLAVSI